MRVIQDAAHTVEIHTIDRLLHPTRTLVLRTVRDIVEIIREIITIAHREAANMVEIQLPRQIIAIMDIQDTASVLLLLLQHISAPAPREATNVVEILEEIQLILRLLTSTLGIREAADVLEIQTQIQRLLQTLKANRIAREVSDAATIRYSFHVKSANDCSLVAVTGYDSSCILQ